MTTVGLAVLIGTLIAATAIGLVLRIRSGRVRHGRTRPDGMTGGAAPAGTPTGWQRWGILADGADRVLLLQLSSPVCAPCRQTATLLSELAERTAGLRHVEIDIAQRPRAAAELAVMRTPTVIAFDRDGRELLRVSGVPRVNELLTVLRPTIG